MDFSHYNGTSARIRSNSFQPNCRIRCQGARIQVGEREFISASEALQAYLDQYIGIKPKDDRYDMNVTDLLDPKSVLHMTAERSLKTGVRATPMEMKLAQSRDAINSSYDRMTKSSALRAEGVPVRRQRAEDALNRSGKLLNRIAKEKDPVAVASDVGSMSTDVLLSMNPVGGYSKEYTAALAAATEAGESRRHGHVYSYRTERTRSRSLSRERPSDAFNVQQSATKKDYNTNNRPPSSYRPPAHPKERSRSMSPSSFRHHDRHFSNPLPTSRREYTQDTSKQKAPSWIEAFDISNPGDNLWSKRDLIAGRPPPSWVQGLDGSEINMSALSGLSNNRTDMTGLLIPNMDTSVHDNSILSSPPGLSYTDLMVTPTKGKSVNFDLSSNEFQQGKLPGEKFEIASRLPREVLESGNTRLDSSDALDRYLEGLGCGPKTSTGVPSDSQFEVPRCSSLDTTSLLNGLSAPAKSDITGASPISQDGQFGKSPMGSPNRRGRSRSRPQTPDTDLVLDGDRTWEKPMASFKPPVYISEEESAAMMGDVSRESATLTGRTQPGSLETLKNMLFKLQAEASEETSNREKIAQIIAESRRELGASPSKQLEEDIPALKGYNYQGEPGGQSLEKAMVHLGRLKDLVEVGKQEARSRSASRDRSLSRSRSVSPLRPLTKPILS